MTRRAILATLAGAALTACSSTTIVTPAAVDSGAPADSGGGGDDGGVEATTTCTGEAAGAVTSFAQGTWQAAGAYIIGHDAKGLFAFSTTCTHRGCTVGAPDTTGATLCPCHGATFDGNGEVTGGPAQTPLPHFAVTVCNGQVYVDTSMTVASGTRTPAA